MAFLALPLEPPPAPAIATRLVDLGYENVRVVEASDSVTVWFENRRHPTQLEGIAEVLVAASPLATPDAHIRLVPLRDDIPLLTVETTPLAVGAALHARVPLAARITGPSAPPDDPLNPAFNRSDVALQPAFRFDQSTYALLARAEGYTPVGTGLRLMGRVQGAVYPTLSIDPPRLAFRSSGWMAPDFPAVFQIGSDEGKAHVAGEVGYQAFGGLGFLKVKGGLVQDRFPEFVAKAEARVPWLDLTLGGGWGQWPLGDWGPFVTLRRTFPRSLLELGAYKTHFGTHFRATFGIDLGPNPRPAPSSLRVLPIGYWQMSYLATAYPGADALQPDPDVDEFQDRLTPAYVEAHLGALPWPEGAEGLLRPKTAPVTGQIHQNR